MAYTKTNWVDRIVQHPRRFTKSGETGTQVTLVADPGTITNAGTPVNATNLNKIEQGIADTHAGVDALTASVNDMARTISMGGMV